MVIFLELDGYELTANDGEVAAEIVAIADGSVSDASLAARMREHSSKR